ncbi:MAG: RNA polymerase sigma factor SigM [Acidobacteria bacterium]|nr:MAG: RNA polymerase sigma factor SigM [Acidobacteriota bacterium]PYQ25147.1 MAG: RNA polymerase sigma factor SigM [Acidobacteriota bacterium]
MDVGPGRDYIQPMPGPPEEPPSEEPRPRPLLTRALAEHGDRLYAFALRLTRDPDLAADAVQEAFTTALRKFDSFRGEANVATWLHRIVYTKAVDLIRQRGKETPLPEDEDGLLGPDDDRLARVPAWARPPDEILWGSQTHEALEAALQRLTPLQRAVFTLREMDGLSTGEAASVLGLEAGTVRVHLHRARLRLRALLADHFKGAVPR